jgi:hypothetical protein
MGGEGDVHTGFCWGDLLERDLFEDIGISGRIISKCIFKECDGEAYTGLIWLRIGTSGGCL